MVRLSREAFEVLVDEALDSLPEEIHAWLDNVVIVVADWPSPEQRERMGLEPGNLLLGLYEGVPKTQRGVTFGESIPDKIVIFQRAIERISSTPAEIRDQVRRTVLHEIGHHFGMDEDELQDAGA